MATSRPGRSSTRLALSGGTGATASIDVSELTANAAVDVPKLTAVAPLKSLPLMVTWVPVLPPVVLSDCTTGPLAYLNVSSGTAVDTPAGDSRRTSTVPEPAGTVAEIVLSDSMVMAGAGVAPKRTPVTLDRPAPLISTLAPSRVAPGLTPVTTGAGEPLKSKSSIRSPRIGARSRTSGLGSGRPSEVGSRR